MKLNKQKVTNILLVLSIILFAASSVSDRKVIEATANEDFVSVRPISAEFMPERMDKTIITVGEGIIETVPDVAYVSIGVVSEGGDLSKIQKDNAKKMNKIMDKLKELNVKEKHIKTSSYNIYPNYKWYEDTKESKIVGYRVSNTLTVTVEDINKTDNLLDAVVNSGSNNINGISFGIKDSSKIYNQALELAIKNAKEKALVMGKAVGAVNVEPIKITEVGNSGYGYLEKNMSIATDSVSTPISQGTLTVNASVSVEFAFTDTKQEVPVKEVLKKNKLNLNDIFEISTDKETYKKDETLNFSIKNIGKKLSLMLGRDFRIEKFNGETYEDFPLNLMFTKDLIIISPEKDFSQELDLSNFESGEYHIVKNISIEDNNKDNEFPLNITLQKNIKVK